MQKFPLDTATHLRVQLSCNRFQPSCGFPFYVDQDRRCCAPGRRFHCHRFARAVRKTLCQHGVTRPCDGNGGFARLPPQPCGAHPARAACQHPGDRGVGHPKSVLYGRGAGRGRCCAPQSTVGAPLQHGRGCRKGDPLHRSDVGRACGWRYLVADDDGQRRLPAPGRSRRAGGGHRPPCRQCRHRCSGGGQCERGLRVGLPSDRHGPFPGSAR